jgi:hypothetical protein
MVIRDLPSADHDGLSPAWRTPVLGRVVRWGALGPSPSEKLDQIPLTFGVFAPHSRARSGVIAPDGT